MGTKKFDKKQKALKQAVQALSRLPEFKVFMQWLMEDESGFKNSFFPWDEKVTIWNTAKRDTFVKVLTMCNANLVSELILDDNNNMNINTRRDININWGIDNGEEIDG